MRLRRGRRLRQQLVWLLALVGLVGGVLAVPAAGTWGDSGEADGSPLEMLTLTAPTLSCTQSGTSAVIAWTPSTVPTALTYTAELVAPSSLLSVVGNSVTVSPGLLDGLVGGLLGSTLTVRVTASLPGTSWSVSADRLVYYKLVLAIPTVSCTP